MTCTLCITHIYTEQLALSPYRLLYEPLAYSDVTVSRSIISIALEFLNVFNGRVSVSTCQLSRPPLLVWRASFRLFVVTVTKAWASARKADAE